MNDWSSIRCERLTAPPGQRDALVADFFKIVRESLAARESLSAACGQAYVMLTLAKAIEGREALETAAIPAKRDITLDIIIRNVWGTKIPDVAVTEIRRPLLERAANPVATSARSWPVLSRVSASSRFSFDRLPWCAVTRSSPSRSLKWRARRSASRRVLTKISVVRWARMSVARRS